MTRKNEVLSPRAKPIIISEYYDLFEINKIAANNTQQNINSYNLYDGVNAPNTHTNAEIIPTNQTNPFIGFWNDNNFNAGNPNNNVVVAGKSFSPQGYNNIYVEDDGTINCFPPNVSVPHWTKIIFRNFDYNINPANDSPQLAYLQKQTQSLSFTLPDLSTAGVQLLDSKDHTTPFYDFTGSYLWSNNNVKGTITDYYNTPLFLKYDEYPSQSKVIFSGCDKTRNPDIEFNFNNQHNQNEPIKLYLSLSASRSGYDTTTQHRFNTKLTKSELNKLLNSCYWCVEWIYNPETGN